MLKDKIKFDTEDGTVSGVTAGYIVVLLHVALALLVGFIVLFFGGLYKYMIWILVGTLVIVGGSCWYFWHRLKQQGEALKDLMDSPVVRGRAFEVKLLGGVASLKVGAPGEGSVEGPMTIEHNTVTAPQLEDPETMKRRELEKLVQMRRDELITQDEFEQLKAGLMKTPDLITPVEAEEVPTKEEPQEIQVLP